MKFYMYTGLVLLLAALAVLLMGEASAGELHIQTPSYTLRCAATPAAFTVVVDAGSGYIDCDAERFNYSATPRDGILADDFDTLYDDTPWIVLAQQFPADGHLKPYKGDDCRLLYLASGHEMTVWVRCPNDPEFMP